MKNICSRRFAFTLIELLVVISIIAVLASLSFTGIQAAMLAAKKAMARNDMAQIVNGVQAYYTEYGKYPSGAATSGTADTVFGNTTTSNSAIINVLRYKGPTGWTDSNNENPRQIPFLQPKVVAATKGCVSSADGNWYDPWGTQYLLFIDGDYSGDVKVSDQFTDIVTNPSISVGSASVGYYYVKTSGSSKAVSSGNMNFSANKTSILLSWQ